MSQQDATDRAVSQLLREERFHGLMQALCREAM